MNRLYRIFSEKGIKGGISYIVKKMTPISDMEDQIATYRYLLDRCCNMQTFPRATGELRDLQECDVLLLRIFDRLCQKNGIDYWLNFGTLLGAKRHHGFIPWDDDMDVGVLRKDYDKILSEFPKITRQYGIDVYEIDKRQMMSIGFTYKHNETGIWLDIFPLDSTKKCDTLQKKINKYRKIYLRNISKYDIKSEYINNKKCEIFGVSSQNSDDLDKVYFHGPEFNYPKLWTFDKNDIFPTSKIEFEEYRFNCPNNVEKYLRTVYGDHFMNYPSHGIEKHSKIDGSLATRMQKNGLEPCEIKEKLKQVYEKIEVDQNKDYGAMNK